MVSISHQVFFLFVLTKVSTSLMLIFQAYIFEKMEAAHSGILYICDVGEYHLSRNVFSVIFTILKVKTLNLFITNFCCNIT